MKDALAKLKALGPALNDGAAILLKNFAIQGVEKPAKRTYVPVMDGHLRSSIKTSEPEISGNRISVTVAAGGQAAPYALRVHENPRSGKTGGLSPSGKKYKKWAKVGQWKYLETPLMLAAKSGKKWLSREADYIVKQLRGAAKK